MARRALGAGAWVEDVVQETLARAIAALQQNRLERPEKLGAFVAGIARHVIADVARERSRMRSLRPDVIDADPEQRHDALAALISEAERHRVHQGLAGLSEPDRNVLRLSFFEGLSPAEIAERMREPASRIRKRKSRALERLRRALLGQDPVLSRISAGTDKTPGHITSER